MTIKKAEWKSKHKETKMTKGGRAIRLCILYL